jgi:predicted RNA-binding protein with PIN domain
MAYLIDGNNVMAQTPGWHRDKAKARRELLQRLAAFRRIKKCQLTVVFDGSPDREFPDASAYRGVKVLFAEPGSDADTRIIKLVEAARDQRGITVVTSDRNLQFQVRTRDASVMRSGEFRKQLESVIANAPRPEDGEQVEIDDVSQWLRYFGATPEDE